MDRLNDADWRNKLPFTRKPIVQHIHPDEVVGITDTTGSVKDHTYITAMGLLRVGLDTVQYNGTGGDSVKERIDKLLRV